MERFLKKLAQFSFLINSKEFLIFSRPNGDIDKLLSQVQKLPTHEIVERMRTALSIEDHLYDPIQKDKLDSQCKEFQHFARQVLPVLKGIQKDVAGYMNTKSQSIQDYKIFLQMLDKYEELNLANYVEGDESKMVFGNTQSTETTTTKEQVSTLCESLKNPFFNIYHWVKGEIFDIEAVANAIGKKDAIQA